MSDEHWSWAQLETEERGYDREAYEYEMGLGKTGLETCHARDTRMEREGEGTFIFKLEEPLSDGGVIQKGSHSQIKGYCRCPNHQ